MGKDREENFLVVTLTCLLAIVGVVFMKVGLKLDYQTWSFVYLAAASTAAIRWTSAGATVSILSTFRAVVCLGIGLGVMKLAGYPGITSFQTASLVPREIMEALGHFHVFYDN
jgi:hypothetical protein